MKKEYVARLNKENVERIYYAEGETVTGKFTWIRVPYPYPTELKELKVTIEAEKKFKVLEEGDDAVSGAPFEDNTFYTFEEAVEYTKKWVGRFGAHHDWSNWDGSAWTYNDYRSMVEIVPIKQKIFSVLWNGKDAVVPNTTYSNNKFSTLEEAVAYARKYLEGWDDLPENWEGTPYNYNVVGDTISIISKEE